jgi:hypothetical protein
METNGYTLSIPWNTGNLAKDELAFEKLEHGVVSFQVYISRTCFIFHLSDVAESNNGFSFTTV